MWPTKDSILLYTFGLAVILEAIIFKKKTKDYLDTKKKKNLWSLSTKTIRRTRLNMGILWFLSSSNRGKGMVFQRQAPCFIQNVQIQLNLALLLFFLYGKEDFCKCWNSDYCFFICMSRFYLKVKHTNCFLLCSLIWWKWSLLTKTAIKYESKQNCGQHGRKRIFLVLPIWSLSNLKVCRI